jgi:hypothetical protein
VGRDIIPKLPAAADVEIALLNNDGLARNDALVRRDYTVWTLAGAAACVMLQ